MKTRIEYSRKDKEYRLLNLTGEVLDTWPAGEGMRQLAEWAQLTAESPAVAALVRRMVARNPVVEGRALRAAQLLLDARVRKNGGPFAYDVDSQTIPGQVYHVDDEPGAFRCECEDFEGALTDQRHSAPWIGDGPKCKHILAVVLTLKLKSETVPVAHTETVNTAPSGGDPTHTARQGDYTTPTDYRQAVSPDPPDSGPINQQRQLYAAVVNAARAGVRILAETRPAYRVAA